MKKIEKVSMIGLGALGILFGSKLSQNLGENFRVIANAERIARYAQTPFTSNGEVCSFNFTTPEMHKDPADFVIVAVKSTTLNSAIADMRNAVGPNTVIISLLNGVTSEEILQASYPNQVVNAIAVGMDATRDGQTLTYHNMGKIQIGEADGSISTRVKAIADLFECADVPYEVCSDIIKLQWSKMIVNVGANQSAAVFNVPYSGLQQSGKARDTFFAAMRELIAVANCRGISLGEDDVAFWDSVVAGLNPDGMPSMRQDVLAGRLTEKELFSGTVCHLGKKYGIATPINDWLYSQLCDIEAKF